MSREEFIKYVEGFGRNPGEYTDDELYEIGLKHKTLSHPDVDWSGLVKLVGGRWPSGNAYRNWIIRKQIKDGNLKHNPALLSTGSIEESSDSDLKESLQGQLDDIYKARQLNRDILNEHRRLLRDDARIDRLKESIGEAVKTLAKLPEPTHVKLTAKNSAEAILMLSDLHIGMTIDSFSNKYNLEIASKRLDKLTDDTIRYCLANKVRRLNVVNMGDLISGAIHITIRLQQEFDVIEQTMQAAELLSRMLSRLTAAAPEVVYRSCTDNHSRLIADKNQAIEKENFYRIMDWFIEERLKDSGIRFEHDNMSPVLGRFNLMNGKLVMFAHGHHNKINTAFQDFIGASESYVDYVLMGHYHTEKVKFLQNMKIFINGSICGTDPYAEGIMKFTRPAQTLLVFDGDNVINHSINLNLR